jgi:hypothetical protein
MRACYDCGVEPGSTSFARREIVVHHPNELGYDVIVVPLCRACIGRRFGHECPTCGLHHDTHEDARYCCQRRPGEAPDCPHCGRRMARGTRGAHADGRPTVEWAECECCPVAWGRFTGWHQQDDAEPCEHVETDPRGESA